MNKDENTIIYTAEDSVNALLLGELKSLIYEHKGSAFIKFVNITISIEYLGACLDNHDFLEEGHSKERFDAAIIKLFNKKYHPYAKSDNKYYLYEQFRCPFTHQLRPGKNIVVTHREESKKEGTTHLEQTKCGELVLVLEDFYDDLESACKTLIKLGEKGKLPSIKMQQGHIKLVSLNKNSK